MGKVNSWNSVSKNSLEDYLVEKKCDYIIYELGMLPDFSEPRFAYLGENVNARSTEMLKKQLQMLRQFHTLGTDWGISLRLMKKENRLRLCLLFRHAGFNKMSEEEYHNAKKRIHNAFVSEYSFSRVEEADNEKILDVSWAKYGAEFFKEEQKYNGNLVPFYYSCSMWNSTSNDLQNLCKALLRQEGNAVIDVTLVPTVFTEDESQWLNNCTQQLKEALIGERIKNAEGRILKQFDPIPMLKVPVDNYEKMIKKYESSDLFLTSLRIFSEEDIASLQIPFITSAVKNKAGIRVFQSTDKELSIMKSSFYNVDISGGILSDMWRNPKVKMPYRAQRLNRLADVEEIINFFRIPTPIENSFPGFTLDTGLGERHNKKRSNIQIQLGNYIDDTSGKDVSAEFDVQQLAKHGLIVGVPGSGKTTAMFNILHQLWAANKADRIPFIVLEPAKTEFRALKSILHLKDDLLVFTLGDEKVSPFRFNPFEVLPGISLERHISRLNACFVGAFDLFDPLPLLLDQAIRRTYQEKGWYEDSVGGEIGVETPTLSDLCRNAEYIVEHSGFDSKMISDFKASLLQRLNSLRRGSKGRMLDTQHSIPMEELMGKPVILELDALNEDEKSLMMMFILSFVFEYCKVKRKSGSPLKHLLVVEEAHNLIGEAKGSHRANPKEQTIQLFVNMLAEMRALGQGILIADQLPTAIASQAVKQTNVKILMRVTSKDDREEMGNTMDLSEIEMKNVVHFKTGHAYVFHEELDKVRMMRMLNYKEQYQVEEPPSDEELRQIMKTYEIEHPKLFLPYKECKNYCEICNRRTRSQAEQFTKEFLNGNAKDSYSYLEEKNRVAQSFLGKEQKSLFTKHTYYVLGIKREAERIKQKYHLVDENFPMCAFEHLLRYEAEKDIFDKYGEEMEKCYEMLRRIE